MSHTPEKIIRNPNEIRIPPHTLIGMCGSQSSGKTTFTEYFFGKDKIVSSDTIFEETAKDLLMETECRLGITPHSEYWKKISYQLGKVAIAQSHLRIFKEVQARSRTNQYVVLDSLHYRPSTRHEFLRCVSSFFENIYLILLLPSEKVLKSRIKEKSVPESLRALGGYYPMVDEILMHNQSLKNQVESGNISDYTTKSFVITGKTFPNIILPE